MPTRGTRALFAKAKQYIPYGVNSNFRYWGDEHTPIIHRGEGAHVWDADDNRFIDYRLGFGPIILGHAYPAVTRRVTEAIQTGVLFAATTPVEIELAERFTRMTGMDKVRLSNTGTEANMHALRIARAYTGREKFIKFEGNYHGNFDYVMFSGPTANAELLGPRGKPHRVRGTEGMPLVDPQLPGLAALQRHRAAGARLCRAGRGAGRRDGGADHGQRGRHRRRPRLAADACATSAPHYGVVLIFDEVKTGFRMARGGAQEYFGVTRRPGRLRQGHGQRLPRFAPWPGATRSWPWWSRGAWRTAAPTAAMSWRPRRRRPRWRFSRRSR